MSPVREEVRSQGNRRHVVLAAAASCFQQAGYAAASMRDISAAAGMQPASLYYHFDSKDDLFVAVHEEGLRRITEAVVATIEGVPPGWGRLEAAAVAHLTTLLEGGEFFKAVMRDIPAGFAEREVITEMRDAYESIFAELIAGIDLPASTDPRHVRLMLLGAMNWCFTWYRPDGTSPADIARDFVSYLRSALDTGR